MPGEHFVVPPHWEWYILGYFFFAGITGGSFVLGTMLRLWGDDRDAATSRAAFLISFPTLLICPILLTLDLGQPLRFWHFLINDSGGGLAFKSWSPMSLGAWALLIFGVFSFVMFLVALAERDTARFRALQPAASFVGGMAGRVFMVVGALVGLFVSAYTGVLLAVSNQPVWSDTWALGGLFLASALSGSAASVLLATRNRRDAMATDRKLIDADRYFILLELALIVLFLATLGGVLSRVLSGRWILLWVIVLAGTLIPLGLHWRATRMKATVPAVGSAAAGISLLAPVLVLLGVLALRAVIIFSAQA